MNGITVAVLVFSILGAADYLFGKKIGMGKEFQKAFSLFCSMAFDSGYVLPMIVGKIVSGVAAVALAMILYRKPETAE